MPEKADLMDEEQQQKQINCLNISKTISQSSFLSLSWGCNDQKKKRKTRWNSSEPYNTQTVKENENEIKNDNLLLCSYIDGS